MYRLFDNKARTPVGPKTEILQRIDRLHRDTSITLSHIGREDVGDPGHRHRQGSIPTYRVSGTPYTTAAALDDWLALSRAGKIPAQ